MAVMSVLETITRNDEAAGCFLIDTVVYDYLADVAKAHEDDLREVYSLWSLDRVQVAKRALGRRYVSDMVSGEYPGDDVLGMSDWLSGIERFVSAASVSKAFEYFNIDGNRVRRDVNRDSRGQFARGVNQNKTTKLRDVAGQPDRISPTLKGYFDGNLVPRDGLDPDELKGAERHQGQWDQVNRIVSGFSRDFKGSEKSVDVLLTVQDSESGDIREVGFPLSRFNRRDGDSPEHSLPDLRDLKPLTNESIMSVRIEPNRNASDADVARLVSYNSLGSVGGQALASLANADPARLENLRDALRMPGSSDAAPKPGLSRLFGLLGSGAKVLEEGFGSNKVTQMARFVGAVGPQAEEVLSPYVRRAAYRYRGTEVKPSTALNPATADPNIEATQRERGLTGDSLAQQVIADNASLYLATTLPKDPILARLSEKSGQVLPSRGAIFDSQGRPVTEAVGFTDDHYLPFDLKNLGSLRGGQYVRTRVTGGLTGEDVYAAVMTGARNVQVVSESGVFTLEFQPDFRGARANSDKARSMYDRYLKILDAVDKSGLYLQDLPPQKIREINRMARDQAKYGGDEDAIREELTQAARDEMDDVSDTELKSLAAQAFKIATGKEVDPENALAEGAALPSRQRRAFNESLEDAEAMARSSKVNRLRLNGEGYATALKTLEAQFPQFIRRTDRRDLSALGKEAGRDMPKTRRLQQDRGYVSPGGLRADKVRSGFYASGSINQSPKSQSARSGSTPASVASSASEGQSAGATGQETTPKTGGETDSRPGAPDPATARGAEQRFIARQKQFDATFKKKAAALGGDLSLIVSDIDPETADSYQTNDFESMTTPQRRAMWLIANIEGDRTVQALTDPGTREDAISALTTPKVIKAAFTQLMKITEASEGGMVDIGGEQMSVDDAVDALSARAGELAELSAMAEPFAAFPTDPAKAAFHTGLSPMRIPEISSIGSVEQLEAYAAKNPAVASVAAAMGKEPMSMLGGLVKKQVGAMAKVSAAKASGVRGTDPSVYMTKDEFAAAYPGREFTIQSILAADPQKDAMDIQRAWSLAVTAKVLQSLGDDLPKDGAANRPLSKAAAGVRVLAPTDPLSIAVADRVMKGLPFVPRMVSTGLR
jgi:hypothetical protein